MSTVLDGIRVVELGSGALSPQPGQTLGDLGAEVVKVEHGARGDAHRPVDRQAVDNDLMAPAFAAANRNKRSICVDLATPGGEDVVRRLVERADVLLHDHGAPCIERLALGHADLAGGHPRLIHASISSAGSIGSTAAPAGHELLAQATSGLTHTGCGRAGHLPRSLPGTPVIYAASALLVQGILGALLERGRSGRGQEVTVSLFDTALAMQGPEVASLSMYGRSPGWEDMGYRATFTTRDGTVTVVGVVDADALGPLCRELGVDDLTERAEFSTPHLQARNGEAATALLTPAVAELTNLQALEVFETAGLACAPRLGLRTLLDGPRVGAGPLLVDVDVAGQPAAQLPRHPVHMSRSRAQTGRGVPALGQDTENMLAELGFVPGEIRALAGVGAIRPDADREIRSAANYV